MLFRSGRDADLNVLVKQNVRFVIIDVNEQRRRAVGSIRQVQKTERDAAKAKFWESAQVGDVYTGEVKSLTSYGAFVDLQKNFLLQKCWPVFEMKSC